MKTPLLGYWKTGVIVWASVVIQPFAQENAGIINLLSLPEYAGVAIPDYITRDNIPENNPVTDMGATLGRVLFYDVRLSKDGTISCSSCHKQEHAFGDTAVASVGVAGTTGRHSMRLVNIRYAEEPTTFWDERAATLEQQTTQPIRDHIEMGFSGQDGDPGFEDLLSRLSSVAEYGILFTAVYGDSEITESRIQMAISQFVRSIQSFDSRYDEGRKLVENDNVDFPNFSETENLGKRLYISGPANGAACLKCHRPPEFDIDPNSRSNGVIGSLGGGSDLTNTRSPTLRDLVGPTGLPNGPFMHDGSLQSLNDVIDHYSNVPDGNRDVDPRVRGQQLNLSASDKLAVVAFLKTLTGSSIYTDKKWSDPFSESGELTLLTMDADGLDISRQDIGGVDSIRIRATVVPSIPHILESSTDLKVWNREQAEVTPGGELDITMPMPDNEGPMFYRLVTDI